ncbi:MAG TPA: hypothetical protein VHM31_12175 [Polyangia bacterium]|nr:hypothetical protein [Polyangia bacterium]
MAGSLFVVGLAAGTNAGCGSSSSSDAEGLCNQACDKEISCNPNAAAIGLTKATCMSECMKANNTSSCPNASAIAADFQACLKMSDCTAFQACVEEVPDCTSGGTGGSSGTHTGGTSGTGTGGAGGRGTTTGAAGSGGTADCTVCDKATACCTAVGGGAACSSYSAATCSASGAAATYASACQQFLTAAAASGNAACQ